MFDIASITTTLSSIKAAKDLTTALVELRDFNQVAATVTKLNRELIQAQEGVFALQAKVLELHLEKVEVLDKLREFEQRSDQRRRYELVELATGDFAYRLKASEHRHDDITMNSDEPIHYVCQPCMDIKRVRSVLRRVDVGGDIVKLNCPTCKDRIRFR